VAIACALAVLLVTMVLVLELRPARAGGAGGALVSDPNFPLIRLPAEFDSHRTTRRVDLSPGGSFEVLNVKEPGCVRHFWITATAPESLAIEIACDGAEEPQVKMSMHRFFGVLLDQKPYRIESAPIKLLPRSGFNSYFPIPFQSSCRIVLRNTSRHDVAVWSMANWQKYEPEARVTPFRLHALFTEEEKAEPFGTSLLGSIGGKGFVAGMLHAIRRYDERDMIWHTGGDTWLIDGETNPHALRGIGSEDVFCHSFGVYKDLSQWSGGVHAVGENKDCSEVVAYRFFGPDSVAFNSSLVLRFGTRANHVENVLYHYTDPGVEPVEVESPKEWTLSGPFTVADYETFEEEALPDEVMNGTAGKWDWGGRSMLPVTMSPEHTWVDFARWYRINRSGNTGTQPHRCAAYAGTVIASERARKAILRLGFDDWMKIWLNGKPVATLRHDDGVRTADVPVSLEKGENRLVIRLSNFDNTEWRCWAFSCVVRDAE
jgi:hypothetical protein